MAALSALPRHQLSDRGRVVPLGASWTPHQLRGPNRFAILGGAKQDLNDVDKDAAHAVSVERFIERSEGYELVEVSVHSGPEHISAKTDEGAISSERLRGLSATFEGAGEVARSIVSTRSGRVNVSLAERTGTGVNRTNVLMADLLTTTIPLVDDLPKWHREAPVEFLAYEKGEGRTPLDMSALEESDEEEVDDPAGDPNLDEWVSVRVTVASRPEPPCCRSADSRAAVVEDMR